MIFGFARRNDSVSRRNGGVLAFPRLFSPLITLILALAVMFLGSGLALAQEPSDTGRIDAVDDVDFPQVRTIVTIVDATGRPITGLTPNDFVVKENGADASVLSVETVLDQQIGVGVILVIDTSGSMEGEPITLARNAARSFVQSLQEQDQAAVISFANEVTVQSPLSVDRGQTLTALDGLFAGGNTALYSSVVQAVRQAQATSLPRKVIILLSDGQDFGGASQNTREEALALANSAKLPIYAIGVGQSIDRPFLEELASASGGAFIEAPAPSSIPQIYDQLSQLLRSQYVVTLESGARPEVAERNVRMTVTTPQGVVELSANYTSSRTIVPASPTPVPSRPAPIAAEPEGHSGSSVLPLLLLAVLGVGGIAFGLVYARRMKLNRELSQELAKMGLKASQELKPGERASGRGTLSGPTRTVRLISAEGDEVFEIGAEPVTLGAGPECRIQLEDSSGRVAPEHARIWLGDGNLMLHHLAPSRQTLVGGHAVTWVSLDQGDEVEIGPYKLRVEPDRT